MIKRGDLYRVLQGINLAGSLTGIKFSYSMSKNKNLIMAELKSAEESLQQSPEMLAFEKDRMELVNEYGTRDKKGNLVVENNQYAIEKMDEFNEKVEALKKVHKEAIDENQKKIDEYNEFMKEEIDMPFHMISMQDIPENISVDVMDQIMPLVSEK